LLACTNATPTTETSAPETPASSQLNVSEASAPAPIAPTDSAKEMVVNEAPKTTKKRVLEDTVLPKKAKATAKKAEPVQKKNLTKKEVKVTEVPTEDVEEAPTLPAPPQHTIWDGLLKKYVTAKGKVNYKGFKSSIAQLEEYLALLADNPIQSSWSRKEKMAYWINAYNAFTVKLILDNYPTSSITNLHGGKPWDVKWIKLGDKTYSLNNIENDILRPQYKDARIHFAVNCAAKSCPPLLNQAWTAANLNRNFEKQAKLFINNSSFNTIAADQVQISKIFEWYAGDFGNIIDYLNKYSSVKINADAKVAYGEYNWALNN
ncbi:MAG: DUF547 domain-containing protein, partial [Bacteroidota bacterium]